MWLRSVLLHACMHACMLQTLCQCPTSGSLALSPEFQKDLSWFVNYLATTQGVFLIHPGDRTTVCLYGDAYEIGCGAVVDSHAYHALFPSTVLRASPFICHLEALNAAMALKRWAPILSHHRVHLFCDNVAAVYTFQVVQGRDPSLQ